MLSEDIRDKLLKNWPKRNESVCRNIYWLHRYFINWHQKKWKKEELNHLRAGYIPLLANIGIDGSTNKDLAQKAMISKQGMSQLLNDMLADDIIEMEKNTEDGRYKKIMLTNKGAELLIKIWEINQQLFNDFASILGESNTRMLVELTTELRDSLPSPITETE